MTTEHELIERLDELEKKATPGPWMEAPGNFAVADCYRGEPESGTVVFEVPCQGANDNDLQFLIALRNAYPSLRTLLAGHELLLDVAHCGMSYESTKYREVQIDNDTWDKLQALSRTAADEHAAQQTQVNSGERVLISPDRAAQATGESRQAGYKSAVAASPSPQPAQSEAGTETVDTVIERLQAVADSPTLTREDMRDAIYRAAEWFSERNLDLERRLSQQQKAGTPQPDAGREGTPETDALSERHERELNLYLSTLSNERYISIVNRQSKEKLILARSLERRLRAAPAPREPTREMIESAMSLLRMGEVADVAAIYRAMLAAAPGAEGEGK